MRQFTRSVTPWQKHFAAWWRGVCLQSALRTCHSATRWPGGCTRKGESAAQHTISMPPVGATAFEPPQVVTPSNPNWQGWGSYAPSRRPMDLIICCHHYLCLGCTYVQRLIDCCCPAGVTRLELKHALHGTYAIHEHETFPCCLSCSRLRQLVAEPSAPPGFDWPVPSKEHHKYNMSKVITTQRKQVCTA